MEFITNIAYDYHDFFYFAHIAGAIVALGGVVAVDLILLWFKLKPKLGSAVVKIAPLLSLQVWIGLTLLSLSGIFILIVNSGIEDTPEFQAKMFLVLILFLNGIFLNNWVNPKFEKLLPEWEQKTPRVKKFMAIAGMATAVSFLSWWGVIALMILL